MKKTSIMLVSVLAFCGQAMADTSDGTRGFGGTNLNNSAGVYTGQVYAAPKAATNVYEGLDWNRDQTYAAHPGIPLTADELKAQQAANTAARRVTYDALVAAGGCNGDEIPVEYHTYCNEVFRRSTEN